jgi:diacylglycerol kinase (ATP)
MNARPTKPFNIQDRVKSFRFAWQGLIHAFRVTHNFYIHSVIAVMVVFLGIWLKVSATEWAILILCIGWVSAMEILNTALEELVDWLHPEQHPIAGRVKDLAAAAVLVAAIAAAIAGLFILLPKLLAQLNLV